MLLDLLDDQMTGNDKLKFDDFDCSLFSANGDANNQLFGRNFDNNDNDVLFTRFQPLNANGKIESKRLVVIE